MPTAAERLASWERVKFLTALGDPVKMARYCWGPRYHARAHHRLIGSELAKLGRETSHLMIWCPPQTGKSVLVSEFFPFWRMCKDPRARFVIASYGDDLAIDRGAAIRKLVTEHGHLFGVELQRGSANVKSWRTTRNGGVRSVGVGGGLTGHPINALGALLVDDPHKDRQEANSKRFRDRIEGWYTSTALTRRAPGTPVLIVNTRWHPDDLSARLIKKEGRIEDGGKWKVIHLEAIATGKHKDPLGREAGDPLTHPAIPDTDRQALLAFWHETRDGLGPYDWASLAQGDPQPEAGALVNQSLIDARRHLVNLPDVVKMCVAVDPSGDGEDACGLIAAFYGSDQRVYIVRDATAVMPSTEWPRAACKLAAELDAEDIVVEDFGGGMAKNAVRSAWDNLKREWEEDAKGRAHAGPNPYDRLPPFMRRANPRRGKYLRASPVAQLMREDRLRFAGLFSELEGMWTSWQESDPDSPNNLDACVIAAWHLAKVPGLAEAFSSPVDVSISSVQPTPGDWTSARIDRQF